MVVKVMDQKAFVRLKELGRSDRKQVLDGGVFIRSSRSITPAENQILPLRNNNIPVMRQKHCAPMQDQWADCMVEQIEKGSFQEPHEIANGIDPVFHIERHGRHGAGEFLR